MGAVCGHDETAVGGIFDELVGLEANLPLSVHRTVIMLGFVEKILGGLSQRRDFFGLVTHIPS